MQGTSHEASNEQLKPDKSEENITDINKPSVSLTDGVVRRGKCKWFNVSKGWGFITPDDGSQDVFVHQSVLDMAGFRSLGENEVVDFISKEKEKGAEATMVTGPNNSGLQGSKSRGKTKKHFRKTRCYNCGDFLNNHKASECPLPAQPKKCHICMSSEHLMAQCPQAKSKNRLNEATTP